MADKFRPNIFCLNLTEHTLGNLLTVLLAKGLTELNLIDPSESVVRAGMSPYRQSAHGELGTDGAQKFNLVNWSVINHLTAVILRSHGVTGDVYQALGLWGAAVEPSIIVSLQGTRISSYAAAAEFGKRHAQDAVIFAQPTHGSPGIVQTWRMSALDEQTRELLLEDLRANNIHVSVLLEDSCRISGLQRWDEGGRLISDNVKINAILKNLRIDYQSKIERGYEVKIILATQFDEFIDENRPNRSSRINVGENLKDYFPVSGPGI